VRRRFAQALCIFPFEEKFYSDAAVPTRFIGHPLVGTVEASQDRREFCRHQNLDPQQPIVSILPGSRSAEIAQHLPVVREAATLIHQQQPVQFVVAAAPAVGANELRAAWDSSLKVRVVEGQTYNVLSAADAAIISSGTATVEATLLNVPMVVIYRVTPLTALLAKPLVRTSYLSMVNLIAERSLVPELIQKEFTPQRVAEEILHLLRDSRAREEMRSGLAGVRQRLGPPGAVERAADAIVSLLTAVNGNA
jgi:lipid-A-disaccharide synthase